MNRLGHEKTVYVLVFIAFALGGCSSMKIDEIKNSAQRLVLEEYFSGKTRAWGLFEDRFGTIRRQFVVDIDGKWDGTELVLNEDFTFADGEKSNRVWRIRKLANGTYEGSANDIIGVATGTVGGNALHWRYVLDLEIAKGRKMAVQLDDWMFLQPHGVLMNRARMSKFGIELGQITISFSKISEDSSNKKTAATNLQPYAVDSAKAYQPSGIFYKTATRHPNIPNSQ
jgi:hypothetical protein